MKCLGVLSELNSVNVLARMALYTGVGNRLHALPSRPGLVEHQDS